MDETCECEKGLSTWPAGCACVNVKLKKRGISPDTDSVHVIDDVSTYKTRPLRTFPVLFVLLCHARAVHVKQTRLITNKIKFKLITCAKFAWFAMNRGQCEMCQILSCRSSQPSVFDTRPCRRRTRTFQLYSIGCANVHPQLTHASLNPPESIPQTASRSVQPLLHSSRQTAPISYNGLPLQWAPLPLNIVFLKICCLFITKVTQ